MVLFFEWISMRARRTAVLSILSLSGLALIPTSAAAGRFHVYSCRTPSGESAPVDGWSGSLRIGSTIDDRAVNTCATQGALVAALGDQDAHVAGVDEAAWAFQSPPLARIVGAKLWRADYLHGGSGASATYQYSLAGSSPTEVFDQCLYANECQGSGTLTAPTGAANEVIAPAKNLGSQFFLKVSCGPASPGSECGHGFGDPNGYAAVVYLYAADITLEQAAGPTASNVGGELAGAPTVTGRSALTFNASDPGAGVYQAVFSVDGQVVQRSVLDEAGGRCRDVGQTTDGTGAFLYLQPCPGSVGADVALDTTRVANGAHRLTVSVIDAAGNAAAVLDRVVTFYNPPAPGVPGPVNGINASAQARLSVRWKRTRKPSLTSAFDGRQTITGRLTGPGGLPIAAAQIDVAATPSSAGRTSALPALHTGRDGRFVLRLARGLSSRTLRFAYRTHLGDLTPAATGTLTLRVRAGLALSITPRAAGVGQSILFRGHLRGGPIPASGKQLVLEARSPGGSWIEFKVVRTDSKGRYRASYRFKFPGPAVYQFRVVCEPESDYPFAAGSSQVLAVRER
jgi:hypothetical protein